MLLTVQMHGEQWPARAEVAQERQGLQSLDTGTATRPPGSHLSRDLVELLRSSCLSTLNTQIDTAIKARGKPLKRGRFQKN